MDEILSEFLNEPKLGQYPIADHLQKCPSIRRVPDTERGITCEHFFYWGMKYHEQFAIKEGM